MDSTKALQALKQRAFNWRNNTDKARVSVPLGEIRAALSALAEQGEAPQPIGSDTCKDGRAVAPYHFRRFVDGVEMAEGVEIHNASTVEEAFRKARAMYGNPRGMDLLVALPKAGSDQ